MTLHFFFGRGGAFEWKTILLWEEISLSLVLCLTSCLLHTVPVLHLQGLQQVPWKKQTSPFLDGELPFSTQAAHSGSSLF